MKLNALLVMKVCETLSIDGISAGSAGSLPGLLPGFVFHKLLQVIDLQYLCRVCRVFSESFSGEQFWID